jgi:hypothetical protein
MNKILVALALFVALAIAVAPSPPSVCLLTRFTNFDQFQWPSAYSASVLIKDNQGKIKDRFHRWFYDYNQKVFTQF